MKSKLNELRSDSRGVSPVIGVVLMIAVVVILAAVVGAFATGVFDNQQNAPQASFSYDADDGTITMQSGDAIDPSNLYYTVGGSAQQGWTADSGSEITAGDTESVASGASDIQVIWDDGNGNSAVLAEFAS